MKNTVTIFLAIFLSISFVFTAVIAVFSASVVSMANTDNIVSFVEKIDYKEVLEADDDITDVLEEYKVKESAVEDILKSDAVAEIIDVYAEQFSDFIRGNEPEEFTSDDLKDIVDDNIDELVEIANEHMTKRIDEDELKDRIITAIDENAEEIIEVMPSVNLITEEVDSSEAEIIRAIFNPAVPIILVICSVILAVLIFMCRMRNAQGFLWLSADCFVSFVIVGIIVGVAAAYLEPLIIESFVGMTSVVGSAFEVAFTNLGIGIGILAVAAILFFVAYFIFRKKILPDNHSYVEVGMYNK